MAQALTHTSLPRRALGLQQASARRSAARARLPVTCGSYSVTLQAPNGKTCTFQATSNGPSIYDLADAYGAGLPASCKQGSCSACCAKVLKGKVSSKGQTCIPPGLAKEGYVTLCTARPQSDVLILTHQGRIVRAKRREEEEAKYR